MDNRIKIIFILPSLNGGGAEKVVLNIIKKIDKKKFEAELLVFNKSGPLISFIPKYVNLVSFQKKRLRHCFIPLIMHLYKKKPNIIFSTFGYINLFLITISFFLPKKTNIVIREANTLTATIKANKHSRVMNFLYCLLYKKAKKIIALSKGMAIELKKNFNVSPQNINVIYNPVELKLIRNQIKKIKRYHPNKICFISSGRLVKQKGFDRLITVFKKFPKNSHLIIMGEGPELRNLKNIANKFNLQSRIKFIGFKKNPWKWYAGSDAMLITSYWEGMPNNALEALACGCKIISVNGLPGLIDIKKLAIKDTVSIESFPNNFLKAIKKVRKKKIHNLPYKSILPNEFKIENSLKRYEEIFFSI